MSISTKVKKIYFVFRRHIVWLNENVWRIRWTILLTCNITYTHLTQFRSNFACWLKIFCLKFPIWIFHVTVNIKIERKLLVMIWLRKNDSTVWFWAVKYRRWFFHCTANKRDSNKLVSCFILYYICLFFLIYYMRGYWKVIVLTKKVFYNKFWYLAS